MKRTWITEVCVILGLIGGGLIAGAAAIPDPANQGFVLVGGDLGMTLKNWLNLIGTILMSIGGGGGIYRVSKKASQAKDQPVENQP